MFASSYSSNVDTYSNAQTDYDNLKNDLSNGIEISQSDIQTAAQAVSDASKAKNQALYSMATSGVSAAVVWWWNVRDIGKTNSDQAATYHPITIGMNQRGQVQVSLPLK